MSEPRASDAYVCIRCAAAADRRALADALYHCARCDLELAHLDLAPNGTVRQVIGWLRARQEVLQERYQVAGVLGRGGFAVTYLVEDLRLKGKRRALKEIPSIFYDEYETTLLSHLQHPAIPDIVDRFELDGMMNLVLEFGGQRTLEGERQARDGTIPVAVLLPWMRQLCDALSYLHGQDPPIVHRDLKPENILLDQNDRIMLIDFGIAKESGTFAVTRTVARSASHGFSPPEQVLGAGTDERSDVYSLGATMYALLTGHAPPPAHERVAGRELAAPRALAPAIPAALEAAIVQALSLNVHHRQQSIAELGRICEPGALDKEPARKTTRLSAPTERLSAPPADAWTRAEPARGAGAAAARTPRPPSAPAEAGAPRRHASRIAFAVAGLLVVGLGAAWVLVDRGLQQHASGKAPAPSPADVAPALAPEVEPTAARTRVSSGEPGAATRALEESLRGRAQDDATNARSARGEGERPRTADMAERLREALRARDLSDVTVNFVDPSRVRLGNLKSDGEAKRAVEVATSVLGPGIAVDAVPERAAAVQAPERAARRPPPAKAAETRPAAAPVEGAPNWGEIRREGATKTD